MASNIFFDCSCGWRGSVLLGSTMSEAALPDPRICRGCATLSQQLSCLICKGPLEKWDQKTCPACGKEVSGTLVAMVD